MLERNVVNKCNPFRYRGYYYDVETGYYYLQSRYYNPAWGRFLNTDGLIGSGGFVGYNIFSYCNNNPINGIDPCGTCFHRWDFWNNCDQCELVNSIITEIVTESIDNSITRITAPFGLWRLIHYSRNSLNEQYTEQELIDNGYTPLPDEEAKFHQNNKKDGDNRKYVVGEWFSSENVYYSDGTLNDTPEDEGTVNVYYGDNWFGKIVIHGLFDVVPYMLWGNSEDDSTTIIDRIWRAMQ